MRNPLNFDLIFQFSQYKTHVREISQMSWSFNEILGASPPLICRSPRACPIKVSSWTLTMTQITPPLFVKSYQKFFIKRRSGSSTNVPPLFGGQKSSFRTGDTFSHSPSHHSIIGKNYIRSSADTPNFSITTAQERSCYLSDNAPAPWPRHRTGGMDTHFFIIVWLSVSIYADLWQIALIFMTLFHRMQADTVSLYHGK